MTSSRQHDQTPLEGGNKAQKPEGMGRKVGVGMVWLMLNTAVGRAASFLALIPLGAWLTKGQYGVVAMAVAFSAFVQVFRDGGARRLLIQRGAAEYDSLVGPIFWMSLTFNIASAILMASLAPVAAAIFGTRDVIPLLLVIATFLPLSTPAMIYQAKLSIDLRFRALAQMTATVGVLRWGLAVLFVGILREPIGIVIPMPICAVVEGVWGYLIVRDKPWKRRAAIRRWGPIIKTCLWIVAGTLATSAYNQGPYIGLGVILAPAVVGVYYFGFQISKQVSILLQLNLQTALLPSFSRLQGDSKRQRAAVLRTIRLLTLISAPTSYLLLVIFRDVEQIIWGGKWAGSVPVVQLLCAALPMTILSAVPRSVLMSIGRFRQWSLLLGIDAAGVIIVATVAAYIFVGSTTIDVPTAIAISESVYITIATVIIAAISLRHVRVGVTDILAGVLPAIVVAGLTTGFAYALVAAAIPGATPLVRIIAISGASGVLWIVVARFALHTDLSDIVDVSPTIARRPARKLLCLARPASGEPNQSSD